MSLSWIVQNQGLIPSPDKSPSGTLTTPVTDEPENTPPWASAVSEGPPPGLRRRKKVKGYCINSEEERSGESDYCLSGCETEETNPWEPPISSDEPLTLHSDPLEIRTYTHAPPTISAILPSLLPITYIVDNASVTSTASFASSAFDTMTYHRELREAQVDSDFDQIIARLLSEWYYTGASVCMTVIPIQDVGKLTFYPSSFPLLRIYPHCNLFCS